MKSVQEGGIRLRRKPKEAFLLGVLLMGFIAVLVVLVLFSGMMRKMGEQIYQGVDRSVRLDSDITTLNHYGYTDAIYSDIQDISKWLSEAKVREGVESVSYHYALTPQWKNGEKALSIEQTISGEEGTKNDPIANPRQTVKTVLLYGQTKQEQESIHILSGRGFTDQEWGISHQNTVVPKTLTIWDGKSIRPIQIGDTLELYFPHPLENFPLMEGVIPEGHPLKLSVIGTYEPVEKKSALSVEDAKRNQRIYVSNTLVKSWIDRLFVEENALISQSTGPEKDYLYWEGGVGYGAKLLFPTVTCDSLSALEREIAALRQFGFHLEKYDAQGNLVRQYTTTSTIDEAKQLDTTTKMAQRTILGLFAIAAALIMVLFVLIYFLFFQTRKREMPLRLALGSTFSQMRRLFFLEKAWIVLLSGIPGVLFGFLLSRRIAASLCAESLRQQRSALILSSLSPTQQAHMTEVVRETFNVHLSPVMVIVLFMGILILLYLLTTWAMRRTMKRMRRLG